MNHGLIVYPILVQMALTLGLLIRLGLLRVRAIDSKQVKMRDIALNSSAWPDHIQQSANSYRSQFELPVLFYALGILLYVTWSVNLVQLALAWAFVASRFAHCFIHITDNHVRRRFMAFLVGVVALVIMVLIYFLDRIGVF